MNTALKQMSILVVSLILAVTGFFFFTSSAKAFADASRLLTPDTGDGERTITVARTTMLSGSSTCVSGFVGTYRLDQFTRIALSSEITKSTESSTGMKAFSLILRGLGVYHDTHPQYGPGGSPAIGFCSGVQPFYYDIASPARVAFTPFFSSAGEDQGKGNFGNKPNDRVTDTMGTYMQPLLYGQDTELYFNDCIQQMINNKAATEPNIEIIIRSVFSNTGSCGYSDPCFGNHYCQYGYYDWRFSTYPINMVKSMTNGVAVSTPPYSSRNINAIVFNQARQAEQFWGNDMGHGLSQPFGQPGTYIIGVMHAQMVEYLAYYSTPIGYRLYVNAIADRPQPVYANIYIDGKYWGWLAWNHNDNNRHIDSAPLPALSPGYHAIAIQFRLAAWTGSGNDGTRWLYLDDLGIAP